MGCSGGTTPPKCPGGADAVPHQLTVLGYAEASPAKQVFEDPATWEAYVAQLNDTGQVSAPTVDFDTNVAFIHAWVDGGCEEDPAYTACSADGEITMWVALGKDRGCDASFPQVDVLVVPRSGATSFTWGD